MPRTQNDSINSKGVGYNIDRAREMTSTLIYFWLGMK